MVLDLQLVKGRVVSRSFGADHFLDSISRFVCDSLQQMSKDLARLPEPSPIRICEMQALLPVFRPRRKTLALRKTSRRQSF